MGRINIMEVINSTKSNLQIQCSPNQNTFLLFTEVEKILKTLMKIKNIMKRQNNPEQEEPCWRDYDVRSWTLL